MVDFHLNCFLIDMAIISSFSNSKNLILTKKLTLFEYIIDSFRKNDNYSVSDLCQNHYSFRSVINYLLVLSSGR